MSLLLISSSFSNETSSRVILSDDFEDGLKMSNTFDKFYQNTTGVRFHSGHPRLNNAYLGGYNSSGNSKVLLAADSAGKGYNSLRITKGAERNLPFFFN